MTVETPRRRGPIYAEYRPPAPIYERKTTIGTNEHCNTYRQAPAYSIGLKRRDVRDDVPGPGYSFDSHLTNKGLKRSPYYSLSGRHPIKAPEEMPGPGSYDFHNMKEGILSKENKPTSISIGQRTTWPFKNESPPSNTYRIRTGIGSGAMTERQAPSWSLRPTSNVGGSQYAAIKANNPGPGRYGSVEPNVFKKSAGCYTIQGRTQTKNYNSVIDNPGPGSYEPGSVKNGKKVGFTMGTRHSEYMMPFITDIDII